ncbi:hypothetical protein, partial [Phocaeicola sartorii]|uniref:hypothetical protein n=1 Tax=Phocaeicola sartorii TaxID=671267 RepID=UPI00248D1E52
TNVSKISVITIIENEFVNKTNFRIGDIESALSRDVAYRDTGTSNHTIVSCSQMHFFVLFYRIF